MSLTSSEMSPADIAAVTGNNHNNNGNCGGWGGDGAWWIIILFLFVFCGWGGFGFGGNGFGNQGGAANSPAIQGALTRGDLCMDMNFQEVKREIQNANDAVNLGFSNLNSTICNQQYDTARMINGLQGTMQAGFNASNIAQLQGQNALSAQVAQCCCENRQGQAEINYNLAAQGAAIGTAIQGVNYNLSTQGAAIGTAIQGVNYNLATQSCDTRNTVQNGFRDLIENQNANARAVLDKLNQQELEAKNARIAEQQQQIFGLQLAASQTAQNQYLVNQLRPCPVPAYVTCNPWGTQVPYGACGSAGNCGCNGYAA